MTNSSSSLALPGKYRWILGPGLLAGFLLCICAGALPDRYEDLSVVGIGVVVACIGGMLMHFGRRAELRWHGISPAVAMLLGALLFLAPAYWRYFESRRHADVSTGSATLLPPVQQARPSRGPRPTSVAVQPRTEVRVLEIQAAVDSAQSPQTPESEQDRVLDQVTEILDRNARPAVASARVGAYLTARHDDSAALKIADAERAIAELFSSLDALRSQNADFVGMIDQVLGDATALSELDAALGQFARPLGGRSGHDADLQTATDDLRVQILRVDSWINGCGQRIAGFKASAEDAS